MKILVLIVHTFRELVLKATIWVLAGISALILLTVLAGIGAEQADGGTVIVLFGQRVPAIDSSSLLALVRHQEASSAGGLFIGIVLFGIFATAGLMPETLEKGIADSYLSKPISRAELLAGRVFGAVVIVLANIIFFLGGIWLIFGIKLGVWDTRFLLAPVTMTIGFFCLYSVVAFLGILSRNTAIAIMGAFLYALILGPVLHNREHILYPLSSSEAFRTLIDGLYYIFPRAGEVQDVLSAFILGEGMQWGPVLSSLLSALGWYGAAWWIFERSDF